MSVNWKEKSRVGVDSQRNKWGRRVKMAIHLRRLLERERYSKPVGRGRGCDVAERVHVATLQRRNPTRFIGGSMPLIPDVFVSNSNMYNMKMLYISIMVAGNLYRPMHHSLSALLKNNDI